MNGAVSATYGAFILREGQWHPWATGARPFMRQEVAYLREMLGLDARMFVRLADGGQQ